MLGRKINGKEDEMQKLIKVRVTFQEETLATCPGNTKVATDFIHSMAPDAMSREEEIAAHGADEVISKSKTIFPKENGKPFIWNYQWKGFMKDACGMLRRVPGMKSEKLKAYQKVIDGTLFVYPRKIFLELPEGKKIQEVLGECERPLRAQTQQGERVTLAISETAPLGTKMTFDIKLMNGKLQGELEEWLNYGIDRGFSQWRNSGKGIFTWEKLSETILVPDATEVEEKKKI